MFGSRALRPEIPLYVPEVMAALMKRCWHKDPNERPEFSEVLKVISFVPFIISATLFGLFTSLQATFNNVSLVQTGSAVRFEKVFSFTSCTGTFCIQLLRVTI